MAVVSKKDKLIEEAQKLSLRGQFDKAAQLYEQVMALEPSATNLRQKLAETLIKAGRTEDARKEFETIGKSFAKNGFYLKAIAVYKQLQKLSPGDFSISLTLAELNEKHGLTANAISEYKLVYDNYEKAGNITEALKILERMQAVDSANLPTRIKLAEAYFQNNRQEDSYTLFRKIASTLQERGDNATLSRLNARIQQLFPDKTDFILESLADQVENGNPGSAVNLLQGLLRSNPNDKRVWDLIIEAYRKLAQPQRVRIAYQHYLKYFPEDLVPMVGLMTCCAEDGDFASSLELLDRYEARLYSSGRLVEIEKVYRLLLAADPVNIRSLEGLIKLANTSGRKDDLEELTSRLASLHKLAKAAPAACEPVSSTPSDGETSAGLAQAPISSVMDGQTTGSDVVLETASMSEPPEAPDLEVFEPVECPAALDAPEENDEDIEIEIDIDLDHDFEPDSSETGQQNFDNNWLDSLDGVLDTIATAPSGVRFGNEMESSDSQSHFDLGLAFKEMGLYDEAINEFRKASDDRSRRLACLIMQGACLRERGEFDTAENMLNALLKPGLSREDTVAVKHELILTCQAAGKDEQAASLQKEMDSETSALRDADSARKDADLENCLDFSEEDLKDFDL